MIANGSPRDLFMQHYVHAKKTIFTKHVCKKCVQHGIYATWRNTMLSFRHRLIWHRCLMECRGKFCFLFVSYVHDPVSTVKRRYKMGTLSWTMIRSIPSRWSERSQTGLFLIRVPTFQEHSNFWCHMQKWCYCCPWWVQSVANLEAIKYDYLCAGPYMKRHSMGSLLNDGPRSRQSGY